MDGLSSPRGVEGQSARPRRRWVFRGTHTRARASLLFAARAWYAGARDRLSPSRNGSPAGVVTVPATVGRSDSVERTAGPPGLFADLRRAMLLPGPPAVWYDVVLPESGACAETGAVITGRGYSKGLFLSGGSPGAQRLTVQPRDWRLLHATKVKYTWRCSGHKHGMSIVEGGILGKYVLQRKQVALTLDVATRGFEWTSAMLLCLGIPQTQVVF